MQNPHHYMHAWLMGVYSMAHYICVPVQYQEQKLYALHHWNSKKRYVKISVWVKNHWFQGTNLWSLIIPCDDKCMLFLFNRIPWVEIGGTTYCHGSVVVLNSYLLPVFGIIRDTLVIDTNDYYFVCKVMETIQFVSHYHAFEVATDISHSTINICKHQHLLITQCSDCTQSIPLSSCH